MSELKNVQQYPQHVVGTVLSGQGPATGQQLVTEGGTKTFSRYSGTAGGDAVIHVGAGRLDYVQPHVGLSGVAIKFYDSAVAVSGGPIAASGHKILGVLPANTAGLGHVALVGPLPLKLGAVFTSGLCITGASGQDGVTVSYSTVISG